MLSRTFCCAGRFCWRHALWGELAEVFCRPIFRFTQVIDFWVMNLLLFRGEKNIIDILLIWYKEYSGAHKIDSSHSFVYFFLF